MQDFLLLDTLLPVASICHPRIPTCYFIFLLFINSLLSFYQLTVGFVDPFCLYVTYY